MDNSLNKNLLRIIQLIPIILSTVFTLIIITLLLINNRIELKENISSLRAEFNERQKLQIKNRVDTIYQQVSYERDRMENLLKADIKEKVYQAHDIANAIYTDNDDKSADDVQVLIVTALKSIRFNNGRGYYFIYDMDGNNIMLPHHPDKDKTYLGDMKDSRGNYFIREFIALVKNKHEGFAKWWFYKPDNKVDEQEKIGFVKHFEPYGWVIGSGEYVEEFETTVKNDLLHWISTIRFGSNGYIFVLDDNGVILAHQNNELITQVYGDYQTEEQVNIMFDTAKNNGGYVTYDSLYKPAHMTGPDKISYVKWYPDWQWVMGSGVYVTAMEEYLQQKEHIIVQQNRMELFALIGFSLLLILVVGFFTQHLRSRLTRRFSQFEAKIETSFIKLKNANGAMRHMTLHDPLTGLPNRTALDTFVQQRLTDGNAEYLAIAFVDIDNFKYVNDLYGHTVGDELLCAISRQFETILDSDDMVCRFGGDEFLFCFSGVNMEVEIAAKIAKINAIFDTKMRCSEREIKSNCSVGVSVFPDDGQTLEVLIGKADIALYKAKGQGKGKICLFEAEFDIQLKRQHLMKEELYKALERGEFKVNYQPQVNVNNKQVVSVEALCRWNSPVFGVVSPVEFITAAEKCGAIHALGLSIIKIACEEMLSISPNGHDALALSINISPIQVIEPEFFTSIKQVVNATGIDSSRVTFELTESAAIDSVLGLSPLFHELRQFGFGLSLDDFGTGFSSLSYLGDLPFSEIKIDRSFINKFLANEQSDALVKTIIAIGNSFNMTVVAEGVETQAQYEKLRHYNCDLLQGYFFAKPLCLNELVAHINRVSAGA
ncbi:cache domain-containing protein [Moritella sp. F3]|uniref:bifunctional diguanylate cyclase/phosphodiesterase n=1 Tax=Moritella sp. F3 TaxID=2718882 RepID=UPI0018E17C34|nr:cache domain-containing protein [Moritella sp. F3]GIC79210.1 diguanylate cyclase [Moritella sp. F1]GIC81102.1 diguanylate cyclase [Moritella sp. F3]